MHYYAHVFWLPRLRRAFVLCLPTGARKLPEVLVDINDDDDKEHWVVEMMPLLEVIQKVLNQLNLLEVFIITKNIDYVVRIHPIFGTAISGNWND